MADGFKKKSAETYQRLADVVMQCETQVIGGPDQSIMRVSLRRNDFYFSFAELGHSLHTSNFAYTDARPNAILACIRNRYEG
jgi:hypothetical protein